MSDAGRSACPVLTCTRTMPSGFQIMCAHCWANVPKDLRKQILHRRLVRGILVETAIAAAQREPS